MRLLTFERLIHLSGLSVDNSAGNSACLKLHEIPTRFMEILFVNSIDYHAIYSRENIDSTMK